MNKYMYVNRQIKKSLEKEGGKNQYFIVWKDIETGTQSNKRKERGDV